MELGPKLEGLRIARSGLAKDDTIVINGLQRVRPGSQVDPEDAPMASPATLAALAERLKALQASNLPKAAAAAPVNVASVATPRG